MNREAIRLVHVMSDGSVQISQPSLKRRRVIDQPSITVTIQPNMLPDGTLDPIQPPPSIIPATYRDETDQEWLARLMERTPAQVEIQAARRAAEAARLGLPAEPLVAQHVGLTKDLILEGDDNGAFREAWGWNGERVVLDMEKARAIHLARLRVERNAALAALDGAEMAALGTDSAEALAEIRAQKKALRDAPQEVSGAVLAAASAAELRRVWPDALRGKADA